MVKINDAMLPYCSLGVRRYAFEILSRSNFVKERCGKLEYSARGYLSISQGVLWSPGQGGSLVAKNQVVTCHDVIDFTHYGNSFKARVKYKIHLHIYQRAKRIVFISDFTRSEFERVFPNVTTPKAVIRSGYRKEILLSEPHSNVPIVESNPYFILVTNSLAHKNTLVFLKAFIAASKKNGDLSAVIVGDLGVAERSLIEHSSAKIKVLKGLTDEELSQLMAGAEALISPSFVEGHNLPVAEAISLGVPVVLSDIPVHREYYDEFGVFFNPESSCELENIMLKGLIGGGARKDLRCWSDVADDYASLLLSL